MDRPANSSERTFRSVLAIILNYRTPHLVTDCLESFAESATGDRRLGVVVVDNASGDSSAEKIRTFVEERGWTSWCRVVEAEHNGGFSAGNNVGIGHAPADAYLLINSDTLVRPNAAGRLITAMERRPDSGIASPRLEWPDETPQISCFRFFRPLTELVTAAATGPLTRLLRHAEVPLSPIEGGGHAPCEPDWTSFAAVLIRREVFEDVGLMDEGYFMYFEDVDFCRMARAKGWEIVHVPDARIVHLRGGTSPVKDLAAARKRSPRYYYAARSRYYAKHFGRWGLLRANLFWTLGWSIAVVRRVIQRRPTPACRSQWRDIWTNFRHPLDGPSR